MVYLMSKDDIDIAVFSLFPSFILMLIVSNIYSSFQNRNTIVIVCIQIFGNNVYYYYVLLVILLGLLFYKMIIHVFYIL